MDVNFELIVVGGGPSGIAAAIAAARRGIKTILVEQYDVLGGMATVGLVNNFCNAHFDGKRFIIGGIFAEIREKLIQKDALFVTGGLEPFNHKTYAELLLRIGVNAGVDVQFGRKFKQARLSGNKTEVLFESGPSLTGDFIIDASGDAALLADMGVPFKLGGEQRNGVMPLTFCYIIGPFDPVRLKEGVPNAVLTDKHSQKEFAYLGGQPELIAWVKTAKENGELTIPRDRIAVAYSVPGEANYLAVNFGMVSIDDPTDPQQLAEADEMGRAQAREGEAFFKKYVPGFENARIVEYARQIGVRESRQIIGQYCLTREDVLSCRQFDDVIAQCCYSIDIHDPKVRGGILIGLPEGEHYDIPLRCLVPDGGPPNLLAAGRCISATQEAMSSFRVSPSAMAIGEAAGITAALAISEKIPARQVPYKNVQAVLLENGAVLS